MVSGPFWAVDKSVLLRIYAQEPRRVPPSADGGKESKSCFPAACTSEKHPLLQAVGRVPLKGHARGGLYPPRKNACILSVRSFSTRWDGPRSYGPGPSLALDRGRGGICFPHEERRFLSYGTGPRWAILPKAMVQNIVQRTGESNGTRRRYMNWQSPLQKGPAGHGYGPYGGFRPYRRRALSAMDILTGAPIFHEMKVDPNEPKSPDRDPASCSPRATARPRSTRAGAAGDSSPWRSLLFPLH